ncbi:MAG: hypothetical protein FD189_202 [Elusimicrobia bacterium]|nr:MAG: hypothetical protein FD154_354 [Elusimicrobiota bacterium]KAF0158210.1 MAG: hypothetical protein FD189_202 [Elusimicrobiota bacterium]
MKTIPIKNDLLGIVAFGSIIGNLAQAGEMKSVKAQLGRLAAMYNNLVGHYKTLYREYEAFRRVNRQLQSEVLVLRTENSRLHNQIAAKKTAR